MSYERFREATDDREDYAVQDPTTGKWKLTALGVVAAVIVGIVVLVLVL